MFDLTMQRSIDQQDKVNQLVTELEHLRQLAGNRNVKLEITGRTDGSGTEAKNSMLSQGRAEAVADVLRARLADWANLTISSSGSKGKLRPELTEDDRATNRSVTLKVIVTDANGY